MLLEQRRRNILHRLSDFRPNILLSSIYSTPLSGGVGTKAAIHCAAAESLNRETGEMYPAGSSRNLVRDSSSLVNGRSQSCGHFNPVEKLLFRRPLPPPPPPPPPPPSLRSAPLPSLSTKIYALSSPSILLARLTPESIHYTGLKRECPPSVRPSVCPSVRPEQSHQRLSNRTRAKLGFWRFAFGFIIE